MQKAASVKVEAVASRNLDKARDFARELGIPKVHGAYEDLLADPGIDAVYIPLPNHLHVPWAIKALEAGKHVLCEKPIALNAAEAGTLLRAAARSPRLKIMEAFMYRHHPQWIEAKRLVDAGGVGELRAVQSFFSYFNDDPGDIRNTASAGGGAMMDIGCYCISLSRFLFAAEPVKVCGLVDRDPRFGTDRMFTGIMDFGGRTASFVCATQLADWQRVNILGTTGRVEILIPFNAPPDTPCILRHQEGEAEREVSFSVCDQYTLQAEAMSRAIIEDAPVPTPLTDAAANMRALEALMRAADKGGWVSP